MGGCRSPKCRTLKKTLPLEQLAERHPGLTEAVAGAYVEAAAVCLQRHHHSPADVSVELDSETTVCVAQWEQPTERTRGAWANEIDATEGAAYGVSLAAIELVRGMVAIRRAETRTGADYYIAPIGSQPDDLEDSLRLEVSGTDHGNAAAIRARVLQKKSQLRAASGNLPAIASVVGFKELAVVIASVEEGE